MILYFLNGIAKYLSQENLRILNPQNRIAFKIRMQAHAAGVKKLRTVKKIVSPILVKQQACNR
jgi:hypothetical protein